MLTVEGELVRTVDVARWNPKKSGAVRQKAIARARRLLAKGGDFPEYMVAVKDGRTLVSFVFTRDVPRGF